MRSNRSPSGHSPGRGGQPRVRRCRGRSATRDRPRACRPHPAIHSASRRLRPPVAARSRRSRHLNWPVPCLWPEQGRCCARQVMKRACSPSGSENSSSISSVSRLLPLSMMIRRASGEYSRIAARQARVSKGLFQTGTIMSTVGEGIGRSIVKIASHRGTESQGKSSRNLANQKGNTEQSESEGYPVVSTRIRFLSVFASASLLPL